MEFRNVAFWIQLHHLSLACMNREVGQQIGQTVGEIEDIDVAGDGVGWGKFLRIRMGIDAEKPLARGRMIQLKGRQNWVAFQYEKLPRFCFGCVIICHAIGGCRLGGSRRLHGEEEEKQYGPWLRAQPSSHRKINKPVHRGPTSESPVEEEAESKNRKSSKVGFSGAPSVCLVEEEDETGNGFVAPGARLL